MNSYLRAFGAVLIIILLTIKFWLVINQTKYVTLNGTYTIYQCSINSSKNRLLYLNSNIDKNYKFIFIDNQSKHSVGDTIQFNTQIFKTIK